MKALIVGGDSQIGQRLAAALAAAGHAVTATTRRPGLAGPDRPLLDLAAGSWPALPAADVAFLLAGRCSIAECRDQPEVTAHINVGQITRLAATLGEAFLVFPSTNEVYPGDRPGRSPSDPVHPVSEYGRQKAATEQALARLAPDRACVLRLGKVLHPGQPLFRRWVDSLRAGQPISAFTDMVMAPLAMAHLLALLTRVAEWRIGGCFHYTARREIAYFDAARVLAESLGLPPSLVHPASRREAGVEAPAHTVLDCATTTTRFGLAPPEPEESLRLLAAEMGQQGDHAE